ncbi:MAG TPA: hypothetical protein ENK23_04240 [Sorangium sp.]|nr:hypothetical protein [Sorangium sp.]
MRASRMLSNGTIVCRGARLALLLVVATLLACGSATGGTGGQASASPQVAAAESAPHQPHATTTTVGHHNMNDPNDQRLSAYKQQIGWDQLKEPGHARGGVAAVWPAIDKAPVFSAGSWRLIFDKTVFLPGVVQREWVLRQQRENVSVRVAVSSDGWEAARRHFLAAVSSTSMMTIPYRRSATPIGALSVENMAASGGAVIWIFRNVCFDVRAHDSDVDVRALASWLQQHASQAVVDDLAPQRPPLERIELSDKTVTVGAEFSAKLWFRPGGATVDDYVFSFNNDATRLDLLEETHDTVRCRALARGRAAVTVRVANRATLLAAAIATDIVVQ